MLKNLGTKYLLSLSLLFSTTAPALHAFSFPDLALSAPSKEQVVLATKLALFLSLARLYTKKPSSEIALPSDCPIDQLRYFVDEVLIGQLKKPKELKCIDLETGNAVYEKFEATGLLGSLASPYKDVILPLLVLMSTYKKFVKDASQGITDWTDTILNPIDILEAAKTK